MSEFRKDPIVDRWVIVATERAAKPEELVQQARRGDAADCPFCEGREEETTPEILAVRNGDTAPNGPGWRVRVIPNKYPAVTAAGETERIGNGFFQQVRGVGAHDVVVECPRHDTNIAELETAQAADVLGVYAQRLQTLKQDPRFAAALVFKNYGALAGASMEHCHSQILTTPTVPQFLKEELEGGAGGYARSGRCLYCELLEQELAAETRIVTQSDRFVLFCPFASRFPFEMWILPKRHSSHYEELDVDSLEELAAVLQTGLRALGCLLNDPAYNFYLHSAPLQTAEAPYFHWHFEMFPRLAQLAGFEHGSGMFINPIRPEQAADLLRSALT